MVDLIFEFMTRVSNRMWKGGPRCLIEAGHSFGLTFESLMLLVLSLVFNVEAWVSAYNTLRWPRRSLQPLAMFYLCPARPGDYLAPISSSCSWDYRSYPTHCFRGCLQQAWVSAYNTLRWPRRSLQPLAMFYLCPARPGDYLASISSSC